MTSTHIMIDLETWGKHPGCDIRSIGAVVFNPVAHNPLNIGTGFNDEDGTFYIATGNPIYKTRSSAGPLERPKYPLTRDPKTVKWWSEQSAEAQAAFTNPVDLREACLQFAIWLESVNSANPVPRYPDANNGENLRIWANDPHFDVSILDAVYHAVGLPVPWHYRAPRSMKTVCDLAGMTRDDYCNYGDAHNALHDAIAQAMTVCKAYERLGLRK